MKPNITQLTKNDGAPFVPYAVWKDLFFRHLYFWPWPRALSTSAHSDLPGLPDPTIIQTVPKPDYFFLWLYALLSLLPPSMETPLLLIGPVVGDYRA